jgi:hypothetical protein
MRRWLIGLIAVFGGVFLIVPPANAEPALGVQPLQYTETLKKGERKKAFVDISNPSMQPVTVRLKVQAFKQVDDKGTLSFYDDQKVADGIQLDYQEVEIPAKKALRLYFVVDGAKLPTGDVLAAIFAQTKPDSGAGAPAVRVGTLLILTNDTPGVRQAEITRFSVPWLQVGAHMSGQVTIKNTAPVGSTSGFFPTVTISSWPFGASTTLRGPLVYSGITRTVPFSESSSQLGIYKITASFGASHKDVWTVIITGVWRWILIGIIVVIVCAGWVFARYRRPSVI